MRNKLGIGHEWETLFKGLPLNLRTKNRNHEEHENNRDDNDDIRH